MTGTKGTKEVATRYPVEKGLTAGTTSQIGRKSYLRPVKSVVSRLGQNGIR